MDEVEISNFLTLAIFLSFPISKDSHSSGTSTTGLVTHIPSIESRIIDEAPTSLKI